MTNASEFVSPLFREEAEFAGFFLAGCAKNLWHQRGIADLAGGFGVSDRFPQRSSRVPPCYRFRRWISLSRELPGIPRAILSSHDFRGQVTSPEMLDGIARANGYTPGSATAGKTVVNRNQRPDRFNGVWTDQAFEIAAHTREACAVLERLHQLITANDATFLAGPPPAVRGLDHLPIGLYVLSWSVVDRLGLTATDIPAALTVRPMRSARSVGVPPLKLTNPGQPTRQDQTAAPSADARGLGGTPNGGPSDFRERLV